MPCTILCANRPKIVRVNIMKRLAYYLLGAFVVLMLGPLYMLASGKVSLNGNWRTAARNVAHLRVLDTLVNKDAIVLMSAPTFNWRGMFSVHTWLAIKRRDARVFTVYQCIGWNKYLGKPFIDVSKDRPDRYWFGARPSVDGVVVGKEAAELMPMIIRAVRKYPYAKRYAAWPGPNSNTFISFLLREVPTLNFAMPFNALGANYRWSFKRNDVHIAGIVGYSYHAGKYMFINILGLTLGISIQPRGLIIPGYGLVRI